MIVVADTPPINYLTRLGRQALLDKRFSSIVLPQEVLDELRYHKAPPAVREGAAALPVWVSVKAVGELEDSFWPDLDLGERQTIRSRSTA